MLKALDHRSRAHQGRTRRRPPPEGRGRKTAGRLQGPRASAEREAQEIIAERQGRSRAHRGRGQDQDGRFRRRRTKTAESKIALAEAQALADVRAAAADAAVTAASTILSQSVKGRSPTTC